LDEGFSVGALAKVIQLRAATVGVVRMRLSRGTAFDRNVQSRDESDAYLRCAGSIGASGSCCPRHGSRKLREAARGARLRPSKLIRWRNLDILYLGA